MKRLGTTAILVIVVILLLGGIGYVAAQRTGVISGGLVKDAGSNVSDYSAVFLTNGQVYFGKIDGITGTEVDLKDIYYLQVNQQIQPDPNAKDTTTADNQQPNVVLVKLGEELHGPNDRMRINRDQVLFTESLKKDSKVVSAINDYKAK